MAGKKTFVAGEVLLAQDVNDFLMDQSVMNFATSAARASAIPTPTEGMTSYISTTGTATIPQIETYTGSQWQTPYGMTLVANVTVTSAAIMAINNCFSSLYRDYVICFSAAGSSANMRINAQLTVGGVAQASNYFYGLNGISSTGVNFDAAANADTKLPVVEIATGDPNQSSFQLNLFKPFLSVNTNFNLAVGNSNGTAYYAQNGAALHYTTTSCDGIVFGPASGTFSATAKVYGLRNS
jgi:hypothetical protein